MSAARKIIASALDARTLAEVDQLQTLIEADIGERHERPLGDRWNNHGLLSTSGLKEHKLVELVTNGQDAVLERFALPKFGSYAAVPYETPHEAAVDLLGSRRWNEVADMVQVEFFDCGPDTRKTKQMTPVVRDAGCGIATPDLSQTLLFLGTDHKDKARWQQGAFGLGGASTFRHAQAVVIVSRKHPDLDPGEDRISVVVCQWAEHEKGKGLYYLTTTAWDRTKPDAEPWSAPASEFPDFAGGTQISLVAYEFDSYAYLTHGAERGFDRMLNTRLYEPVTPVSFVNHIVKRDEGVRRIRGLKRQFEETPRKERRKYEDSLPFRINGTTAQLPITSYYFENPREEPGAKRTAVAQDHAVLFTSNGQVHENWSPRDLRSRTELKHIHDRLLIIVELDELPIKVRTNLFPPDRSGLMDTEQAAKLEKALVDLLNDPDGELFQLDREQLRKSIVGERNGRPTINIARQIGRALKFKGGFSLTGAGGGGGRKKRRKKCLKPDLYPDPTTLEGPGSVQIEQGAIRGIRFHINARDEFLASGRGRLEITCTHPDVGEREITVGELRQGSVRVTIAMAEGAELGNFELLAAIRDWQKAAGGVGGDLQCRMTLKVVEPKEKQPPKPRTGSDNAGDEGDLVGLAWRGESDFDDWHGGVPGHVEPVEASMLAEESEDYKELEPLGDTKIPTIFLNRDYTPLKKYEGARANELTEKGLEEARDRYAVGAGLGLLLLDQDLKAKANGSGVPEDLELTAKQAAAQSALVMMPQYDRLAKAAGVEEDR